MYNYFYDNYDLHSQQDKICYYLANHECYNMGYTHLNFSYNKIKTK